MSYEPFALSLSKGFDKACPEHVEGLNPNENLYIIGPDQ
jgi:hypothetical protein